MSTLVQAIAPARERTRSHVAVMAALAVAGSVLMGGLAQWTIKLPFTPVPITGQTLGLLLIGAALGPLWGTISMLLYLIEGGLGLHFFAQGAHGWATLTLATLSGGYLWSYPVAALIVGWLADRGWDRTMRSSISAMLIGEIVVYAFGIPWLMASLHIPLDKALVLGLYPFIIGDTLKLFIAAGLLPAAWRLTGRGSDDEPRKRP